MNGFRIIAESAFTDVLSLLAAVAISCLFTRRIRFHFVGWLVLYIIADNIIGLLPIIFTGTLENGTGLGRVHLWPLALSSL